MDVQTASCLDSQMPNKDIFLLLLSLLLLQRMLPTAPHLGLYEAYAPAASHYL